MIKKYFRNLGQWIIDGRYCIAPSGAKGPGEYFVNWLLWCDKGLNALFGGDPQETVSSRLGKTKRRYGGKIPWSRHPFRWLLDKALDAIDKDHSIDAINWDEGSDAIFNIVERRDDT